MPSLTAANIHDRAAVDRRARPASSIAWAAGRGAIGLVIPDPVAKVSLVRFEQVPARRQDLDQLVRWQVRKAAPFPVEEAQVSYAPGLRGADGQEFVVISARRDIVREYEEVCAELGAHAGIVDLATFNVINAVLAGAAPPAGDWLLVNVDRGLRVDRDPARRAPDLLPQPRRGDRRHARRSGAPDRRCTTRIASAGRGFGRVLLAGSAGGGLRQAAEVEQVRRSLEERLTAAGRDRRSADRRGADRSHLGGAGAPRHAGAARRPAASRSGDGGVIRTNLSTRPFYNERAVRLVLLGAGARGAGGDAVQRHPHPPAVASGHAAGDAGGERRGAGAGSRRPRPRGGARPSIRGRSNWRRSTRARPTT